MGVGTVYHNISAISALRNLNATNNRLNKSLERLSSGLRINRAADDAAGLSVSEKMRAQIGGIDQASSNASDGISMIQTAEGVLDTVHSTLQRMRTLTLQASNDSYTTADRKYIQQEINELIDEIDRIANYTEFNTKKLLNGDAVGYASSVRNDVLTADIVGSKVANADYSITVLKAGTASNVHGTIGLQSSDTMSTLSISDGSELHIKVDGHTKIITIDSNDTLQDVVNAINSSHAGVVAGIRTYNNKNYLTMTAVHSGSRFNISFGSDPDGVASKLGLYGGDSNTATSNISAVSGDSHVRFTSGTDTIISITNITNQSVFPTDIGYGVSLGVFRSDSDIFTEKELNNPVNFGTWTPDSSSASKLTSSELLKGLVLYIDEDLDYAYYDNAEYADRINYHTAATPNAEEVVGNSSQTSNNISSTISTRLVIRDNRQIYQIGANTDQTLIASFGNISASSLGLVTKLNAGGYTYDGKSKLANGATTGDWTLNISVETIDSAQKSLDIIDRAIDKVSTLRSRLGAYQNSLEKSVDYLGIAYENQVASESRIRDVDMAKEMTNFTKQQILMQSGTAMLAQANVKPEIALQLLR